MRDPDNLLRAVGAVLRELRNERGLTQEELFLQTGVHRNYIGEMERGIRNPTLRHITIVANALGTPVEDIVQRAARQLD